MPRYSVTYAKSATLFADRMIDASNQTEAEAKADAMRDSVTGWYPDPDPEPEFHGNVEVRSVIEQDDE